MIRLRFLLIGFCAFAHISNAQNLLPNPSFENITTCIPPNTDWQWNLTNWMVMNTGGTPDAYNKCNDSTFNSNPPYLYNPCYWVPYSWLTYQYPNNGNGFLGLYYGLYYNRHDTLPYFNQGREYIVALLNQNLITGQQYCLGGWMNNMNLRYVPNSNKYWTVFSNQASLGFHSTLPNLSDTWLFSSIDHKCRLTKEDSTLITDTLNWEHIRTPYVAEGNEKYVVLGNLFSDTLSGFQLATNYNIDSLYSLPISDNLIFLYSTFVYFYFDDMYIVPIQEPQIHVALSDTPGFVWLIDTTFQEERSWYKTGDDLVLGNGDSLYLQVSDGSSYTLHTRNCRVELSDTMVIDLSGLEKIDKSSIHLFPNPSNNSITLQSPLIKSGANLFLRDISGRLIHQLKIQELNQIELNTQNLADGIYLFQIIGLDGKQVRERFVVQH